ncbi:MAG: hypothetical protein ACR2P2_11730 [Nakamurella sp.]
MSTRPPRKGIKISADPFQTDTATEGTPPPTEPTETAPAKEQILRPGETTFAEKPFKMTVNLPASLSTRLAGVTAFVQTNETPDGFNSSTDIVRAAITVIVERYEREFNDGKPFPPPRALRRGRGPKSG